MEQMGAMGYGGGGRRYIVFYENNVLFWSLFYSIHVQPDGEVVVVEEEEEEEDGEDQEVPLLHLVRQLSPFFDHLVSCPIMFK